MSNSLGKIIQVHSYGESHGPCVGAILEGIPSGIELDLGAIQQALDKRKPTEGKHSTQRREPDDLQILSGLYQGCTTGAPIHLMIPNRDVQSKDYDTLKQVYRPGHADYTYDKKYTHHDPRGGGRSSIRVWAPIVAAGDICRQFIQQKIKLQVNSIVTQIGEVQSNPNELKSQEKWQRRAYDSELRTPDPQIEITMSDHITAVAAEGDTLGGSIHTSIRGLPLGIGEPIFDKLSARLAQYIFSINTVKALEFGEGKKAARMKGSEHNDSQKVEEGQVFFQSNHAGGMLGGVSTGAELTLDIALKPISSHQKTQKMLSKDGQQVELKIGGRHDVCAVPRAVPIVDAMCYLAISDLYCLGLV